MDEPFEDLDRLDAYRYLTVPERGAYLPIMRLFTGSLMTDLSAQEVVESLAGRGVQLTLDAAVSRLNQLVSWGNLLPSSHTVRVRSIEEYQRARSRYQMSPLGERVQRQADEVLSSADAAREISRELLGLVSAGLDALAGTVERPGRLDQAGTRELVATLFAQFGEFRDSIHDFYAYLAQVIARYDLDSKEYSGFKNLLMDYVESITEEVVLLTPRIARDLDRIWPHLDRLLDELAQGGLAGAAGDLGIVVQRSRGHERADWSALRSWFEDTDDRRSEVTQLRDATMRALQSLLANAKRMMRSSSQGTSRRRELLRLASWLDGADQQTADDLYTSAFALYGARHLGIAADPEAVVPATESWWAASTVSVPVSLRERGERTPRGRATGLPDRGAQQAALIAEAAEAQRLRAAAADELLSASPDLAAVRFSAPAMQLLLELMARALGSGDPAAGSAVTELVDLSIRCELISKPAATLVLRSTMGEFTADALAIMLTRLEPSGAGPSRSTTGFGDVDG